ncbi:MAG: hypothetical protein IJS60_09110 [Abditibacteriota bacterium]|nr:hypothetical protein [Abditibacteriota bacterium]
MNYGENNRIIKKLLDTDKKLKGIVDNRLDLVVKQVAYGEHVYNKVNEINKNYTNPQNIVYNAFIMPYSKEENGFNIICVGKVDVEWKKTGKHYETIRLILLDTKYIMDLVFLSEEKKRKAKKGLSFLLKNCPPIY